MLSSSFVGMLIVFILLMDSFWLSLMDFLACTLPDCTSEQNLDKHEPWWENFTIKLKLSQIYKDRKSWDSFVDTIYPSVRKSFLEAIQQKVIYASIFTLK